MYSSLLSHQFETTPVSKQITVIGEEKLLFTGNAMILVTRELLLEMT